MYKGSIPALMTPMTEDGSINFDQFQTFVDWQITEGSSGLVPVGTTGESPTLSHQEHINVVKACVDAAAGRVPVIAGAGSNSTREAIMLTQEVQKAGAQAALIVTPYYNKPSQAGLLAHFDAIHSETDIDIFIYNIPGRSIVDMSTETMKALSAYPRIVGVKDATGDLSRVAETRVAIGQDFIQLSGEDTTAVGFNAMGGVGCISVTANVAPRLCAEMQAATATGDYAKARILQDDLMALHSLMFAEPSPGPAKYAASLLGLCAPRLRMPLTDITDALKAKLEDAVKSLALKGIGAL